MAETEPCPDPDVWAPGGVVRGCAVLTHWEMSKWSEEPGLVEAAGYRTRYLRVAQGWRAAELDQTWSDELLDVSADGSSWVVATPDDGCCGWSNDCSDQTTFGGADSNVVVFDEWPTFRNKDYDVSFFTAGAHIGPDDRYVALSIHATEGPAADDVGPIYGQISAGKSGLLTLAQFTDRSQLENPACFGVPVMCRRMNSAGV